MQDDGIDAQWNSVSHFNTGRSRSGAPLTLQIRRSRVLHDSFKFLCNATRGQVRLTGCGVPHLPMLFSWWWWWRGTTPLLLQV